MKCRVDHGNNELGKLSEPGKDNCLFVKGPPACTFFTHYGMYKFVPTCKFDHSMGHLGYSESISQPIEISVGCHQIGSTLASRASTSLSSDLAAEPGGGVYGMLLEDSMECSCTSEAHQQPSSVENLGTDAECSTPRGKVGFYFFARLTDSSGLHANEICIMSTVCISLHCLFRL